MFYDTVKFYRGGAGVYFDSATDAAILLGYSQHLVITCATEDEAREAVEALNSDPAAGRIAVENTGLKWDAESEQESKRISEGTRKLVDDLLSQPRRVIDQAGPPKLPATPLDIRQAIEELRREWDVGSRMSLRRRFAGKYLAALTAVLLTTWSIEGDSRRDRRLRRRRDRVVQLLRERPYRHTVFYFTQPQPLGWEDIQCSWRARLTGTARRMEDVERLWYPGYARTDKCWAAIGIAAEAVHSVMRLAVWRESETILVGHPVDLEAQLVEFTRSALDLASAVKRVAEEAPRGYAENIAVLRQLYEVSTPPLEEAWAALVERLEALLAYTEKITQMQQLRDQASQAPNLEGVRTAAEDMAGVNAAHAFGAAELRTATLFAAEYLQSRRDAQAILRGELSSEVLGQDEPGVDQGTSEGYRSS